MSIELRAVVKPLGARPSMIDGVKVFTGRQGVVDVMTAQIGVGPVAAARSTERLLDRVVVDQVVVSGIAGGIDSTATIGSVIVPEIMLDVASGREYRPSPLGTLERAGTVGTVDELIMDPLRLAALVEQGVTALEMESTAVASACEARGIPWTVIRVVSDRPDDGLTEDAVMDVLRPDGSTDIGAALRLLVAKPSRIPRFIRLGRDASMAARRAGTTALGALR
jgi:adenosylhomocysteine nucleosidase